VQRAGEHGLSNTWWTFEQDWEAANRRNQDCACCNWLPTDCGKIRERFIGFRTRE